MREDRDAARRYRLHAEELRTIAESMEPQPSRDALLQVARDYEAMAKSFEAMDRDHPSPKSAYLH